MSNLNPTLPSLSLDFDAHDITVWEISVDWDVRFGPVNDAKESSR